MSGPWLVPRGFAVLSAASLLLGAAVPFLGLHWWVAALAVVGLVLEAAGLAAISHGMCNAVRRRHWLAHRNRRAGPSNVHVFPPRVSDDPDVSLLARLEATPDPVVFWPLAAVDVPPVVFDRERS